MKISEKQIMQLMQIANNYTHKIKLMIEKDIATGDATGFVISIENLLNAITRQQSEELKDIE
jgi:hypothetical protein